MKHVVGHTVMHGRNVPVTVFFIVKLTGNPARPSPHLRGLARREGWVEPRLEGIFGGV